MTGFARFTAIIFLLLGVVLLIVGAGVAYRGLLDSNRAIPSTPGLTPNLSGLLAFGGVVAGGAIAFQGLLLAAVGQVLWLAADMSYKAQLSVEYLAEVVNRLGNVKR